MINRSSGHATVLLRAPAGHDGVIGPEKDASPERGRFAAFCGLGLLIKRRSWRIGPGFISRLVVPQGSPGGGGGGGGGRGSHVP